MAILSFKKRFAGKVRNGSKRQTIRAFRKYPIVPGETLYLYTALRTKWAKKLREVTCSAVKQITISFNEPAITIFHNEGYDEAFVEIVRDLDKFAKSDGFKNFDDMKAFWISEHGVKKGKRKVILRKFEGILIKW